MWLYTAEVMTDSGIGFASCINWAGTILFSLITPTLFEVLSAKGVYSLLFALNIIGFILIFTYIRETKGKSKEELRDLYNDYERLNGKEGNEMEDLKF
mmetsp:Transcript_17677/g.15594  ORF Transcript_17677/g.15594 Transcript_17677/m.15594 type:complete len:98 (+) Transcript_17677:1136-1429(+)